MSVPENYAQPEGRRIDLYVVILPALEPSPGAVPQFDLVGGPGLAATETAFLYLDPTQSTSSLRREREIVLVDQRGTGSSNPLSCPALEARRPLETMYPLDAVRACRDHLETRNDLRQYTTAVAAKDLDQVRRALGYEEVDLWAISYGTILAQVYMKTYPQRVRSAVLVGTAPIDSRFPLFHAAHAQRVLDLLFFHCQSDATCRAAYPELRADWTRLQERLERESVTAVHVDDETGERWSGGISRDTFGEALRNLLYTTADQARVPWIVHRAARGDWGPFLDAVLPSGGPASPEGLYLSVTCPEATARIAPEDVGPATSGTFSRDYRVRAQMAACAEWAHASPPSEFFTPVESDVPVLLITGELDVVTPPSWADRVARKLDNSVVIRLPGAGHLFWGDGPEGDAGRCADEITAQFYARQSADSLDLDCARRLDFPPFVTPEVPSPIPPEGDLGAELIIDAVAAHRRLLTIDSHSDLPRDSCGRTDGQVDIPKMREGGLDVVFEIVFTPQRERTNARTEEARSEVLESFQAIHDAVRTCGDDVELARGPDDVERIVANGKLALAIGVENGFAIGGDLSILETYRNLGAAYIGLTHEGHNDIADSSDPRLDLGDTASEHGGVSRFGERVIAEMNRLGVMVDVSHMSKQATLDAIGLSRAPVIASHSSIHAIAPHPRNLDDETLRALAAKGGVIQITPVHSFIKVDPPVAIEAFHALLDEFGLESDTEARRLPPPRRAEFEARLAELERRWALATIAHFVDHIDYAVAVAGIDHVGIGSDFDGGGGVTGWSDASETANVTAELLHRGYTEEEIAKIWGGNLLRVWREVRRLAADGSRSLPVGAPRSAQEGGHDAPRADRGDSSGLGYLGEG